MSSRQRFEAYRNTLRASRKQHRRDNVVMWHSQTRSASRTRSFRELFVAFMGMLKPFRATVVLALATLTLSTLLALIPPAITKLAIDYTFEKKLLPDHLLDLVPWHESMPTTPLGQLTVFVVIIIIVSFIATVLAILGRWKATQTVKRLQAGLRRDAFEHAAYLPLNRVHELKSGGATSLIREDAGGVADLLFEMLYNPWRAIIQLTGSLAILAWVDWRLLIGACLLLPVVWYAHRTWISRIRPMYRDIRVQRQDIDAHATETFGGMRVVRGFARTHSESARYVHGNHLMLRQELYVWWWARGVELVWSLLIPVATSALLLYGGWQVIQGEITTGDLVMFLAYLMLLLAPLEALANSATRFQTNLAGLDRVLDLLEEERELPDRAGAIVIARGSTSGRLEFKDVSFAYPGTDRPAFASVSFVAEAGSMVALVGRSGAGKTTACNLAARFYDPTSGVISLDNRDLRDIALQSYRRTLGIVEQDVFLFDGTIRDNIAYGKRNATESAITRAADLAAASEFINDTPKGLDTIIGERGVRLSGGQRQRLAIARAILADPQLLILDEATSNLDTRSERLIQDGLTHLMQDRTTLVIAHRLSTIMHADLIVVLQDGQVLEMGKHDELMARSGAYRQMVVLQTAPPSELQDD